MSPTDLESLITLHSAFWNRTLDRPIVNHELSQTTRFRHIPALPAPWRDQDGLVLEPDMLSPAAFQPPPMRVSEANPALGRVAFNTMVPYLRVPWPVGIMGCGLQVSTSAETIWPVSYLEDGWQRLPNQGFSPRLAWLDKLLDFVRYIRDRYYPDECYPAQDMIARGVGDLCHNIMGPQRFYFSLFDHPQAVKSLLAQITELYLRWGSAQLEVIPQVNGGYLNQYGTWCPGLPIRFQEDYALNLSPWLFEEFLMPAARRIVETFDYAVIHTHSGGPQLAEWMLELDGLKAIEVSLDPNGPPIETLIPLWNRILEKKCLYICGPVTQQQCDMLLSHLAPGGLWLDLEMVEGDQVSVWEWDQTKAAIG